MRPNLIERFQVEGDSEYPQVPDRYLTEGQIEEFLEKGVLVVPNVLTPEQVQIARQGLHAELLRYGVDHQDLENTGANLKKLSSTGGAGGILDLFYPSWRLKVAENDHVFAAMTDIWKETYAKNHPDFSHPFGVFNPKQGYAYINRVCYRVPDSISKKHGGKKSRPMQRSLTPHLDCCPSHLYDSGKEIPRWRPIQCITVLTDNEMPNTGGFEAVRGFHKEFKAYFEKHSYNAVENEGRAPVCLGDFSPLRMQEDRELIGRYEHISCQAGSVIFFDWRIPHANSYKHLGHIPREVIYTGFLPDIPMNQAYAKEQLRRYAKRLLPADHWQKSNEEKRVDEFFSTHFFSALGSRLMGIHEW